VRRGQGEVDGAALIDRSRARSERKKKIYRILIFIKYLWISLGLMTIELTTDPSTQNFFLAISSKNC
jgi:hypothetical protein